MAEESISSVPSWMLAADNHNLGESGSSWLDPESWSQKFGNAGKFITASLLAGYNGFANTARAVGKFAGLDTEQESTQALISSLIPTLVSTTGRIKKALSWQASLLVLSFPVWQARSFLTWGRKPCKLLPPEWWAAI